MLVASGYAGKILKVDLSTGNISRIPTAPYADKFVGGRGIAAKLYWDEIPPDIKAFDAENPLLFMTGPLAGYTGLAGSRLQICGKSPAITPEMFCYANLGGSWGAELKFSGWDGIVIQGKAAKPVYLFIQDETVAIRDATALWGETSLATRQMLKSELGDAVKILSTGIAGENLVPFATVLADDDASGTSGFAAVMGSKKLKAVAVRGSSRVVQPARPEQLREIKAYVRNLAKDRRTTPPTLKGTPFPVKKRMQACYGCVNGCLRAIYEASDGEKGKYMCQQSGYYVGAARQYYGEFTDVPFHAAKLCDNYGLDTMVIAPLIKWLYRCREAGILTDEATGIPLSKYGSFEFIESVVKKISLREGFGEVLARGVTAAAHEVGRGAEKLIGDLALTQTGEEWVYDPRMFNTAAIFYAVEPKQPIQHLHEISWLIAQWVAWKNKAEDAYVSDDVVRMVARRFWGSEIAGDFSTYEGKALAAKKIQDRQYAKECLILCDYTWPIAHIRYSDDHLGDPGVESKIFAAVTGQDTDEDGLYTVGERVFNLQRAIFVRDGHSGKADDKLPEFSFNIPLQRTEHNPDCLIPGGNGRVISRQGAVVERDKFQSLMAEYYGYMGWDVTTGLQTISRLEQLGLGDAASYLAAKGLAL